MNNASCYEESARSLALGYTLEALINRGTSLCTQDLCI